LAAAANAGLPIIDLHPIFAAQKDPLGLFPPFPLQSHYNEQGNRVVAETVLGSLTATK
jgi:hypothetical protein